MRVYDGESLREVDPRARSSMQEYKDAAGVDEGMDGISTRFAFKVLAATFNHDTVEVVADPVHLMYVLEQAIRREQLSRRPRSATANSSRPNLRRATPSSSVTRSRRPISNPTTTTGRTCSTATSTTPTPGSRTRTSRTPTPGQLLNRELLNQELTKIEKPAGIANPKDFRNEVVKFSLRARAHNGGRNPSWTSYEKIRDVIERRMFSQVEELSAGHQLQLQADSETEKKHGEFVERMVSPRLHGAAGAAARRMVHAGQEGRMRGLSLPAARGSRRRGAEASTG